MTDSRYPPGYVPLTSHKLPNGNSNSGQRNRNHRSYDDDQDNYSGRKRRHQRDQSRHPSRRRGRS